MTDTTGGDTAEPRSYVDKIDGRLKELKSDLDELYDTAEARMEKGKPETKKQRAERRAKATSIEEEIADLKDDRKRAEARAERRDKVQKANKDKGDRSGGARVRAEPRQYDPANRGGLAPNQFLRDLYMISFPGAHTPLPDEVGSPQARMARHEQEFIRDKIAMPDQKLGVPSPRGHWASAAVRQTQSSDVGGPQGGLVPEQYPGMVGRLLYRQATFLALCSHNDIPQMGMQLSIPRFSAGPASATTAEKGAIADAAVTATNVAVPVVTATARSRVTVQLLERGNMAEDWILDMQGQALKSGINKLIVQSAANPKGFINTIRATNHNIDQDATTKTALKVWQSLGLGIDKIARSRQIAPDAICVHQRRATYLGFAADTQGRPLFQESAATAQNVLGVGRAAPMQDQMPEVVMRLAAGQNVYVDNTIPTDYDTNQDTALAFVRGDQQFWGQSAPMMLKFDQTAGTTLEVDLTAYEFYAFSSAIQPEGGCVVSGSLFSTSLTVDSS